MSGRKTARNESATNRAATLTECIFCGIRASWPITYFLLLASFCKLNLNKNARAKNDAALTN